MWKGCIIIIIIIIMLFCLQFFVGRIYLPLCDKVVA